MCSFSAVFGIIGAVVQFVGQRQQAAAVAEQNSRIIAAQDQANANAFAAFQQQTSLINVKSIEERAAAKQKAFGLSVEATQRRAEQRVASGEAGVTGLSVDALVNDISFNEGLAFQAIDTNLDNTMFSIFGERLAARAQTQRIFNQNSGAVVDPAGPSVLGLIGNIGSTLVGEGMFQGASLDSINPFNQAPALPTIGGLHPDLAAITST